MREKQAEEKGYRFTGSYGRDKDEIKERAKEYKAKGYKVVVVDEPDSKLSRGGGGMGYSVFAERKYFIDQEVIKLEKILSSVELLKQNALDEYNQKLSAIDNQKLMTEERLKFLKS